MKTKHTPGPWIAAQNVIKAEIETADGMRVVNPTIAVLSNLTTVWQDNARLIAAAPEMLEALESLVERCSHFKDQGIKDIIVKQIDDAKIAIAKARGES